MTVRSAAITGVRAAPAEATGTAWGRVPELAFTTAAGLVLLALAMSLAGSGHAGAAEPLFWFGYLVVGAPIVVRLATASPSTAERVVLVVLLGVAMFATQLLRSPGEFRSYDELLHLRSLQDILATGRLFTPNPLLAVSPRYPGLEIATSAIAQVGGSGAVASSIALLLPIRILFSLALFALYREASSSDRVAGLASGLYMINPNFVFFDSQFAYESLALPLVPVLLLAVARLARPDPPAWLWPVTAILGGTLVVTHHITSFEAAGILILWFVVAIVIRHRDRYHPGAIGFTAGVLSIAIFVWLVFAAPVTFGYLGAPILAAYNEFIRLVTSGEARLPFVSNTGAVAPLWERLTGFATAGLLTASIPFGGLALLRGMRDRSLAIVLGLLALGYPASLLGRLMPTGSEAAGRSLAVIELGLAFVTALAVLLLFGAGDAVRQPQTMTSVRWHAVALRSASAAKAGHRVERWLRTVVRALDRIAPRVAWRSAFAIAVSTVLIGGVVIGSDPATRLPGPYLVGADSRSIDPQSKDMAAWFGATFGPNRRVAADRVNRTLLGAYADADVVFHESVASQSVETWQLFLSRNVGATEIDRIRQANLQDLVIDRRLSTALPLVPYYYEQGEIFEGGHDAPIDPALLGKWDQVAGVDRLYDGGPIQVYDVGGLVSAP